MIELKNDTLTFSTCQSTTHKLLTPLGAYSYLPNKRGGHNKQGGWKLFWKSINGEGENVPNKRGGWKCSSNSINGEK